MLEVIVSIILAPIAMLAIFVVSAMAIGIAKGFKKSFSKDKQNGK